MRSWYVAYRANLVEELDQEPIRTQIQSFLKRGAFPHALLFAGPKGTGKTSTARIIAKILNCEKYDDKKLAESAKLGEPCNKCASCKEIDKGNSLSVTELDAASNRGIDDIRALRENVKFSIPGRTKVYIIDEAHMLTTEAANALLKTLEEPPENVVFILATTEAHKIPATIKSRTVMVQFQQAATHEIKRSLRRIAEREKIDIDDQALELISGYSDGSFRDAIKLLEQISGDKKVTKETVRAAVSQASVNHHEFLKMLFVQDTSGAIKEILRFVSQGVSARQFVVQLMEILHDVLLVKLGVVTSESVQPELDMSVAEIKRLVALLTITLEEMRISPIPELPLELAVVEWCTETSVKSKVKIEKLEEQLQPITHNPQSISNDVWNELVSQVKPRNHSVSALLKSARPLSFDGKTFIITVFYKFHKDKLEQATNSQLIEEVAGKLLGTRSVKVNFLLGEKPQEVLEREKQALKRATENINPDEELVKAAEEIFGGTKPQSN